VAGDYSVATDGLGVGRCVIKTTRIDVVPFGQVDAAFAYDEGEGDRTLGYWRRVHWEVLHPRARNVRDGAFR
jgi:uncharacterized protein YhfF